jgi:molybdopterin molybdotransferase
MGEQGSGSGVPKPGAEVRLSIMQSLVSAAEARRIFDEAFEGRDRVERVPTGGALGRVLAEPVSSPEELPPFCRSLMDGYALRAADTAGATRESPRVLRVVDDIAMGASADRPIAAGEAARIPTGGMLPEGADAVVIVEETAESDGRVQVFRAARPEQHTIARGEDVRSGERLLSREHRLRPQDIGALMGLGITEVLVYALPRVGLISTGDEIVPPEVRPSGGQVRDMNSYALAAFIARLGATPVRYGIVSDELSALEAAARRAHLECDMVVINGGSSVGVKDVTAPVIQQLGRPGVLVHGIHIRPGKPTIMAICDGKPVFGLPGQPVSVLNTFELFVAPVLRRMLHLPDTTRMVSARMIRELPSADGREDHVRVTLESREGEWWATPIPGVSAMISTMVRADGITVIPADNPGLAQGQAVEVRLFE